MVPIRWALAAGLTALTLLLAALMSIGLAPIPAIIGGTCGVALCTAVHRGVHAAGAPSRADRPPGLGPADVVTLTRAVLTCALAALVADPSSPRAAAAVALPLSALALALDAVDGRVARATGTQSAFGGRFDGEADAFLLLVLSVHCAPVYGWWVLTIGAARYAYALAGWVLPWLRVPLPFRYWRKVVTAVQGVVLLVASVGVVPHREWSLVLVVALVLLAESFGRDVLWARRHADSPSARPAPPARFAPAARAPLSLS